MQSQRVPISRPTTLTETRDIWVVVPAFNEEASITKTVMDLRSMNFRSLVVDDGSGDATVERARQAGADETISLGQNQGYEAALNAGLLAAAAKDGCRWCVTFDADAQFDAADVRKLIDLAESQGAAGAFGMRPAMERRSERLVTALVSAASGLKDPLCGLKCFQSALVRANKKSAGRCTNMELAAKACINKAVKVVQADVRLKPRHGGVSLFSKRFSGAMRIILSGGWVLWALWLWKLGLSSGSKVKV